MTGPLRTTSDSCRNIIHLLHTNSMVLKRKANIGPHRSMSDSRIRSCYLDQELPEKLGPHRTASNSPSHCDVPLRSGTQSCTIISGSLSILHSLHTSLTQQNNATHHTHCFSDISQHKFAGCLVSRVSECNNQLKPFITTGSDSCQPIQ